MDFKVKITCHKCKCDFELRPSESTCTSVACPNCCQEVPADITSRLLSGLRELGSVPEKYPDDSEPLPKTGFSFSVQSYSLFGL